MKDPREDFVLLSLWREGDETAGSALFDRYAPGVVRFFASKVRCEQTAEDLTQRTFLACVEGRDRIRKDASFRSYVFGIAHNLHREHLRKAARAPSESVGSTPDLGPTASALIGGEQEQRVLLEAMRRLPLELQIVYQLHYWEGLSGSEIAAVVDAPEGTVRTRLRRGKGMLEEEMAKIQGGKEVLQSTITNFDLWARKLRDMLKRRK